MSHIIQEAAEAMSAFSNEIDTLATINRSGGLSQENFVIEEIAEFIKEVNLENFDNADNEAIDLFTTLTVYFSCYDVNVHDQINYSMTSKAEYTTPTKCVMENAVDFVKEAMKFLRYKSTRKKVNERAAVLYLSVLTYLYARNMSMENVYYTAKFKIVRAIERFNQKGEL